MALPELPFDAPPWRLSGVVVGALLNHAPALAALGTAVHEPPHNAPPRYPVLQVKPRNTLAGDGAAVVVPAGVDALEAGASLGIVIGQVACRVEVADALRCVAGYTIVDDLRVPHPDHYRPAVRDRARDGFCPVGPRVVAAASVSDPDRLAVRTTIDGTLAHATDTAERVRGVARLIADVSEFMTLNPGDLLLLGPSHRAPQVRAGQTVAIEIEGLGTLHHRLVAEEGLQ
jgi:5-oxopent-3-ene-1,2,5-tricarboxylate decarboxylase/2-hydroxyhepta-2,4-diene-1,7-dioate isomerase